MHPWLTVLQQSLTWHIPLITYQREVFDKDVQSSQFIPFGYDGLCILILSLGFEIRPFLTSTALELSALAP